ncbi:MAG: transglycosylase SLT domain-containing protein [Rhizobiales bacterium]|nr:transglycosylase SLT domain-containing protein [Hyphomicrobiales bacterium]
MGRRSAFGAFFFVSILVASVLSPLPIAPLPISTAHADEPSRTAISAVDAAFKGQISNAQELAQRSGDPAAVKMVELVYLRDKGKNAGYQRIMRFLNDAPNWPLADTLMRRAEQALYINREPAEVVFAHFAERKPQTSEGMLALVRAYLASGNQAAARQWLAKAWERPQLDAATEEQALAEFGNLITANDHKRRVAALIYAQETNAAIRAAKRLPREYQAAAQTAQALIKNAAGSEKKYADLSSAMKQWLPVQYALARHYRWTNQNDKARAVLAKIPADHKTIQDGEAWWVERRLIARRSLGLGSTENWKTAYRLATAHGFASGANAVEGEFLSGWIALRYLKDPKTALKHFTRIEQIAPTRTDLARAQYWLGRTYAELGSPGEAKAAYRKAAKFPTIYYGQLAREQIGLEKAPVEMAGGQPSAAARNRIAKDEAARAFKMVAASGRKRELNMFVSAFANRFKTIDDMNAAANLAWDAGGPVLALRVAKAAASKDLDIDYWGYPTKAMPAWNHVGPPVEKALVYGLARQESEFDATAGSHAGAQGLMQLMPGTAKIVARQYGLPYAESKLTGDPAYNVKLGAAHLGDLISDYKGSYVLTLVAYNAGPRRAREWLAAYGDLRSGQVDPIDWVESIPFQETRQYVQKVLQNTHIYRSRLTPTAMHGMTADLRRGSPGSVAVATTSDDDSSDGGCSVKPASIADLLSSSSECN